MLCKTLGKLLSIRCAKRQKKVKIVIKMYKDLFAESTEDRFVKMKRIMFKVLRLIMNFLLHVYA